MHCSEQPWECATATTRTMHQRLRHMAIPLHSSTAPTSTAALVQQSHVSSTSDSTVSSLQAPVTSHPSAQPGSLLHANSTTNGAVTYVQHYTAWHTAAASWLSSCTRMNTHSRTHNNRLWHSKLHKEQTIDMRPCGAVTRR
jgi:hypothetical protein